MKLEFQAKFLQHLNNKKKTDEGFTLIELLVVIIIIGVLAAIALPSLLGQVNKAKQSEAKNNIGAVNRAQQAFQLEQSTFTTTLQELGIGIKTETQNYIYTIVGNSEVTVGSWGLSKQNTLRSYVGLVATSPGDESTSEVLTLASACESKNVGILSAAPGSYTAGGEESIKCSGGSSSLDYKTLGK